MKKLLTLVLCWLIAFSAMAETTLKAKTALSAAGGYVTSQNKVDGSFEDGISSWVASVGTIVKTASTEIQGNNIGVWSGTGAGTLDLQWTATASNTLDGNEFVNVGGEDDVYVCAYVGTTETGCKLIPALDKIQKVSVIAASIIGSAFYLRLKHTGSDAFSVKVDDGKIEPQSLQNIQVVEQESVSFTGYSSGTSPVVFKTKDTARSTSSQLIAESTVGSAGTLSRYTILKPCNVTVSASIFRSLAASNDVFLSQYSASNTLIRSSAMVINTNALTLGATVSTRASAGDYFVVLTNTSTPVDSTSTNFSITATAISDNVVQSYSNDRVGETIYSIQNVAPQGFISAQGSILGKTSGSHQGEAYKALYDYSWAIASATAGEPYLISSAKGASAQADWDAGKTITINESGLFTRASGGNAGAIGAKQLDAFQDHLHYLFAGIDGTSVPVAVTANDYVTRKNTYASGLVDYNLNATATGATVGKSSNSSGVSGQRTAVETRSINIAKYVYIRYSQSVPTLLALPVSKENRFEVAFNSDATILKKNTSLINATKTGTGLYTINYSSMGLTQPPLVKVEELSGFNLYPAANPRFRDILTVTATQTTIRTGYNSGTTPTGSDLPFVLTLVKAEGDYTAPGVFVGNVQSNWRYDISSQITAAGMTSNLTYATVEKLASGGYEVVIIAQLTGTFPAGFLSVGVTGLTFPSFSPVLVIGNLTGGVIRGYLSSPGNQITFGPIVANETGIYFNTSKVFVQNKPTWAVNTN